MTLMEIRQRAALYVSIGTKRKILEVVKKIGGEYMTATSYVEKYPAATSPELYKDDINRIHKRAKHKKNFYNDGHDRNPCQPAMRRLRTPKSILVQALRTAASKSPQTGAADQLGRRSAHPFEARNPRGEIPIGADWNGQGRTCVPHRPSATYICPGPGSEARNARMDRPCRAASDRRRRRTLQSPSACRHPTSSSGSPRQSRTPRCRGSCDAWRAGLREAAVMGDATAEERQAIANFDIRAYA